VLRAAPEAVAQPPHNVIAEFPAVVVLDETQQAPVPDAPNDHVPWRVRLYRTARRSQVADPGPSDPPRHAVAAGT